MKKIMYVTLIVVGVILIVFGVIGLTKLAKEPKNMALSSDEGKSTMASQRVSVINRTSENVEHLSSVEEGRPSMRNHQKSTFSIEVSQSESEPARYVQRSSTQAKPSRNDVDKEHADEKKTTKPQTPKLSEKEKGNLFEGYVADCFKDRDVFRVLEWNQGVTSPEGVYAENNVNPDFHIEQAYSKDFKIDYYIEAKYNSHWRSNNIISLNDYQIERYRRHQTSTRRKVVLAIGVGGKPEVPEYFYLVPVDSVKDVDLSKSFLDNFAISRGQVRNYMYTYFKDKVFKKSKKSKKAE